MNSRAKPFSAILSVILSLGIALYSCSKSAADKKETAKYASQTPAERCATIKSSVTEAGFDSKVAITCDDTYAYLTSDTYPAHEKMTGILGTNEQVPVPAPGHTVPVTLVPSGTSGTLQNEGPLGVAVNGVPIYDYSSQASNSFDYDPKTDTVVTGELDHCNGHAGRGDDYHYHAKPTCMIDSMTNKGDAAVIGWAFDGYPILGNNEADGVAIASGALDKCNGKTDASWGYAYHTSDAPPYIVQCLVGNFDKTKFPVVSPMKSKPPGQKPAGGVTGLTFTETDDGWRTMTYTNQGTNYFIKYKSSATSGCYTFVQKTFTNGGVETTTEYCRQ